MERPCGHCAAALAARPSSCSPCRFSAWRDCCRPMGSGLWLRLVAASLVLLIPGALIARGLRLRGASATVAWSLGALAPSLLIVFVVHSSIWLALVVLAVIAVVALPFALRVVSGPTPLEHPRRLARRSRLRDRALARRRPHRGGRVLPSRPGEEARRAGRAAHPLGRRVCRRRAAPRLRLPALARVRRPREQAGRSRPDPGHAPRAERDGARRLRRRLRGRARALPVGRCGRRSPRRRRSRRRLSRPATAARSRCSPSPGRSTAMCSSPRR